MVRRPYLLLVGALSSAYSVPDALWLPRKMSWMNKSYTTLATIHCVAKSYIIIEVAAESIKNARRSLWGLKTRPAPWHWAQHPAVLTDHHWAAVCSLPLHHFSISLPLGFGGRERGVKVGKDEAVECTPAPKDSACYMTAVGSIWNQPY